MNLIINDFLAFTVVKFSKPQKSSHFLHLLYERKYIFTCVNPGQHLIFTLPWGKSVFSGRGRYALTHAYAAHCYSIYNREVFVSVCVFYLLCKLFVRICSCYIFCDDYSLKGTLARDFLLFFFFIKSNRLVYDSYPQLVSNIKSNLPRYSNYSSLCVDSVNAELIFCFKLHKDC